MTIETIADITPNGSKVQVSVASIKATWIKFVANGSTIRVGDTNVGAARGLNLPTGVLVSFDRLDVHQGFYDLSALYLYGTGTDKVSITYGV